MVKLYETPFKTKRKTLEKFEDRILGNPMGISQFFKYIFLMFLYFWFNVNVVSNESVNVSVL